MSATKYTIHFPDGSTAWTIGGQPPLYYYTVESLTWWQRLWRQPRLIEWTIGRHVCTGEYIATAPTTMPLHQNGPNLYAALREPGFRPSAAGHQSGVAHDEREAHVPFGTSPALDALMTQFGAEPERNQQREAAHRSPASWSYPPPERGKLRKVAIIVEHDDAPEPVEFVVIPGYAVEESELKRNAVEGGQVYTFTLRAQWSDPPPEVRAI